MQSQPSRTCCQAAWIQLFLCCLAIVHTRVARWTLGRTRGCRRTCSAACGSLHRVLIKDPKRQRSAFTKSDREHVRAKQHPTLSSVQALPGHSVCWHGGEDVEWADVDLDHYPVRYDSIHDQVCCGVTNERDLSNVVPSCAHHNRSHAYERAYCLGLSCCPDMNHAPELDECGKGCVRSQPYCVRGCWRAIAWCCIGSVFGLALAAASVYTTNSAN